MPEKNLRIKCVTKKRNNAYYFPKSVPRERTNLPEKITIIAILALIFAQIILNDDKTAALRLVVCAIFCIFLKEIFYRTILIFEELKHLPSRYESSFQNLLMDAYHFSLPSILLFVLLLIFIAFHIGSNGIMDIFCKENLSHYCCIAIVGLISKILREESSSLNDSRWIGENHGLDYGSGMSYSFFWGYLKLVLEKTGTEQKNLEELIRDYEDTHKVKFAARKLFVLLPKSLTCPVSLNDFSPSICEAGSSLKEKIITVAGVQNRVYKNAVYKIESQGDVNNRIYVCAEYASPLKTFKDVINHTGKHSTSYTKLKNDIILQFYLTLKKVLDENDLSRFCELIFYEDMDENGRPYDVGDIILSRLKELKRREKLKNN